MPRTLALNWGRYGGFYITPGRVCLGWVAITWLPIEIDDLMHMAIHDVAEVECPACGQGIAGPADFRDDPPDVPQNRGVL